MDDIDGCSTNSSASLIILAEHLGRGPEMHLRNCAQSVAASFFHDSSGRRI